jgi:hypothetical protein
VGWGQRVSAATSSAWKARQARATNRSEPRRAADVLGVVVEPGRVTYERRVRLALPALPALEPGADDLATRLWRSRATVALAALVRGLAITPGDAEAIRLDVLGEVTPLSATPRALLDPLEEVGAA